MERQAGWGWKAGVCVCEGRKGKEWEGKNKGKAKAQARAQGKANGRQAQGRCEVVGEERRTPQGRHGQERKHRQAWRRQRDKCNPKVEGQDRQGQGSGRW